MAWLRMMGADSVAYHRDTVVERGDDHAGQALGYYAERGETPLRWGGSGAARLGLDGVVGAEHYDDLFGVGGARDPVTGTRLVNTKRPGMEFVVSAHKSVAELGVMGRAADMHRIMDAERDATLAYLDAVTRRMGGRRGRAAVPSPTSGLVYATTRHATSRAGDPCPHDHVLVVSAIEMLDRKGGWKAPDTTLWREHAHAATAVGRMASARVAVELGYGLVADDGPSGKLGHWSVAGVPKAAMDVHSKRSEDIDGVLVNVGFDSYRARNVAARDSRPDKRHQPIDDLMAHWRSELSDLGITVDDMANSVAAEAHRRIAGDLTDNDLDRLASGLLGPEGRLAERKVFSRRDVVVAAAPHLFGHDPDVLDDVVGRVLADPAAIRLVGVAGAKEPAFAPACVIAVEHAIEAVVARGRDTAGAARVPSEVAAWAAAMKERELGGRLTLGQRAAVSGITGSGHRVDLVIGVAGSGKTTTFDAVRHAFEHEGFAVVGTATSGQAARTLGRDAQMASRTLASLLWRLDHHQVTLDADTVVVLDEAGMTDDPSLLGLLTAAECVGAKVVVVGDDRQLSAVGPGGSLGALVARHGAGVWVLDENVRQADPGEREALEELRAGDPALAIAWMAANGRIVTRSDRAGAVEAMVEAWAADVDAGRESVMLAWRRTNVEALNRAARHLYEDRALLTGPEVKAPGGRCYRAGDRVVTLAPGGCGEIVTSERGTVTAVNPANGSLQARMDDGRLQAFTVEETGKERLAHGYAITVHRAQGATVDTAHRLEDGGGRELAYVATSRARHRTTVWVQADDLDQAIEDLNRDWPREHRQRWAIDAGTPATTPAEVEADADADPTVRNALRRARLHAERDAVAAAIPNDPTDDLLRVNAEIAAQRRALADIPAGAGRWQDTEVGDLAGQVTDAQQARQQAVWRSNNPAVSRSAIRAAKRDIKHADATIEQTRRRLDQVVAPHRDRINDSINDLEHDRTALEARAQERRQWIVDHPEVTRRLDHLDTELGILDRALGTDHFRSPQIQIDPSSQHRRRTLADDLLDAMPQPSRQMERPPPSLGLGL